jgi:beta-lactamase regulating signal transducer with metallopeptidase domain/biotin carboxyl carrier protein
MKEWLVVNDLAQVWIGPFARACWQGGLAIGLVWITCRVLPGISPGARSWLWRLAFLKLILALLWPFSIDLPLLRPTAASDLQRPQDKPLSVGGGPFTDIAASTPKAALAKPVPLPSWNGTSWLFLAWSIGVSMHLARLARDWRQVRELRRRCRPTDDQRVQLSCIDVAQELHLHRIPGVSVSDSIDRPMLLGPLSPTIVLPALLLANSTPGQIRLTLAHELAHTKRLDLWWGWLLWAGEILFYFHPLVWIGRAEWRVAHELACDALAVRSAKSPVADYASMLLELSALSSGRSKACRAITVGIIETKRNLERRLKAMKFIGQRPSTLISLATAGLLAVGALGALPWQAVARSSERPSPGDQPGTRSAAQAGAERAEVVQGQGPAKAGAASAAQIQKNEGSLKVFPLRYADADDVASHLQALKREQDPGSKSVIVVPDRRTNAVIVHAADDEMNRIADLLQVLDVPTADNRPPGEAAKEGSEPSRPLPVLSPRPGYVQKILVSVGNTVKQGDALIQLDGQDAEGKLSNMEAQLEISRAALAIQEAEAKGSRREYERVRILANNKLVNSEEVDARATAYDVAQARVAKAQAELKLAQQLVHQAKGDLGLLTIRAPRDGRIGRIRVQVGEYVTAAPSQPLLLISD